MPPLAVAGNAHIVSSVNDVSVRPMAPAPGASVAGHPAPGDPAPGASAPGDRALGVPAAAGERAKGEAAELLAALGAVQRAARRAVRGSAYAGPLPPARSELLRLTARRPGISVAEAAQELRLAPNSVSTMVSKLAADGLHFLLESGIFVPGNQPCSSCASPALPVVLAMLDRRHDGAAERGFNAAMAAPFRHTCQAMENR